ncbi:hypothetical protein [Streptomyces sioyaensis]|uniref:hypothetical protein n=1 Tax=Streptomyces sioyaensis TaxID=67364 RepID=UPI0037147D21
MVAIDEAAALELLGQPVSFSTEDEDKRWLVHALSRSLAAEGISDDLIATLEEILSDRPCLPDSATGGRRLDSLLTRLGLPLPPRQRPKAVQPLACEEAKRITDRFRRATRQFLQIVPHRVAMYPTEELRLLLALRDEQPNPYEALSYLRRYALAIVALLDLMGDDEE